ncbi:unnamed protein product [Cylicocyclus nassatus]|uniref:Uncharacterized protein n=1 Tax=Cylicocyclus nassatus TaxID=53992 RepID=A0AA36GPP2_CYLNA|nr:unnamed protein product [Cylicocyclus nassatus]
MRWVLIGLLLLFNLGTVVSLCEGINSKDPLVKKLANEGCDSFCKKTENLGSSGHCEKKNMCTCFVPRSALK